MYHFMIWQALSAVEGELAFIKRGTDLRIASLTADVDQAQVCVVYHRRTHINTVSSSSIV
jgi:hypothetical protein